MTMLLRPDEVLTLEGGDVAITFRLESRSFRGRVVSYQMTHEEIAALRGNPIEAALTTCRMKLAER